MSYVNAIDSIPNDNYWKQYLPQYQPVDTVNYANQLAALQLAAGANTSTADTTGIDGLTFGQSSTELTTPKTPITVPEENKSNTAAWITGGVITAGAAVAFVASRGKTGKGFFENLKAGWKNIFNGGKNAEKAITISQVGKGKKTKTIVTMPSRRRTLKGYNNTSELEMTTQAKDLGLNFNRNLQLTDDAAKLKQTNFEFKIKGKKSDQTYTGTYRNGKVVQLKNSEGEIINLENSTNTKLNNKVKAIEKGLKESKNAGDDVTLSNTIYAEYLADGGFVVHHANFNGRNAKKGIVAIRTNRYMSNEAAVTVERKVNKKLDEALKLVEKGKFNDLSIASGTLKIEKSLLEKLKIKDAGWKKDVELIIKDGEFVGAKKKGVNMTPTEFQALKIDHPEIFDNTSKLLKEVEPGSVAYSIA